MLTRNKDDLSDFYAALRDMPDADFFPWETREQALLSKKRQSLLDRVREIDELRVNIAHIRNNRQGGGWGS